MAVKEDKSEFCVECNYVFDSIKKYHAQDRCNACYQKSYLERRIEKIYGPNGKSKDKEPNCSCCGFQYETLNNKGKVVKRGPKQMCKTCYTRSNKAIKICKECGNQMLTGSKTGLCPICRFTKPILRTRKEPKLPIVDKDQFELIRRLLVRYKVGHNTLVDAFRVADVYMDVNNNSILLDTLNEETQIVEMLKNLKSIFDYNLNKVKEKPVKPKKTIKEYQKEWYEKSPNSYRNKCKAKWDI